MVPAGFGNTPTDHPRSNCLVAIIHRLEARLVFIEPLSDRDGVDRALKYVYFPLIGSWQSSGSSVWRTNFASPLSPDIPDWSRFHPSGRVEDGKCDPVDFYPYGGTHRSSVLQPAICLGKPGCR